ncbi:hypothetical protein AVMA1855_25070 [Acidovorax sp. SUPP1855]|uniref:hypothetical protein n=1 Tax=Acidovorax sp. SUPP1855 TaxID=431774 RepID=UPI0023DE5F8C|nr:hypothetical protein [Acidovorax sp. SUPP1855]GKS87488.1 hypothetical protein AVMA1855_25070 [Acidovorax sp. SUPP1855]
MNKLDFVRRLDAGSTSVSDKTADLWWHILDWVHRIGYADTVDMPEFVTHVQSFRPIEVATISRHLARLAEAGFLKAHVIRRHLTSEAKEELRSSISGLFYGNDASTLPTSFKRYTLADVPCPLEFKTASLLFERNRKRDAELLSGCRGVGR